MRVAVVGVCGSGKTTIVGRLRERGYEAYVVGQEHSVIPDLWNHLQPDRVVYLHASLGTVRERRGQDWPSWIYQLQEQRLRGAREHSHVIVDTGSLSVEETVERVVDALRDGS